MSFLSQNDKDKKRSIFRNIPHLPPKKGIALLGIGGVAEIAHFHAEFIECATFSEFSSTKPIVGVRTKEILDKLAKTAKNGQNIQFFVTF
jgi:hypothetical protein